MSKLLIKLIIFKHSCLRIEIRFYIDNCVAPYIKPSKHIQLKYCLMKPLAWNYIRTQGRNTACTDTEKKRYEKGCLYFSFMCLPQLTKHLVVSNTWVEWARNKCNRLVVFTPLLFSVKVKATYFSLSRHCSEAKKIHQTLISFVRKQDQVNAVWFDNNPKRLWVFVALTDLAATVGTVTSFLPWQFLVNMCLH